MSNLGSTPYRDNLTKQAATALAKEIRRNGAVATVEPSKAYPGKYCVKKFGGTW